MSKPERDYSETLFLPQTDFPMRAGLPQKEPEILKAWEEGDLYGQPVDVAFIGWIRGEEKFASVDALKRAMAADVAQAREALARSAGAFPQLGAI